MSENYEFGPFSVDPIDRLIWCRGSRVTLKGKPFDVLLHLLESGGHALAKEALMGRVWPDAIVEESNLTVAVSQLRRALRGADAHREYVETLPGRGYRFLAHGQPVRPRRGRTTADSAEPMAFHAESGRAREARALLVGRQVESGTLVPGLEEAREGAYATLAEALMLAGRLDEALAALKTGFELVVESNERWWEPELHRVRGELWLELLKHGKDAEGCDVGTNSNGIGVRFDPEWGGPTSV